MASEIKAGDWKEGDVRAESDPDQPPRSSSISKADEISAEVTDQDQIQDQDQDHSTSRNENSGARRFPRIGLNALMHRSQPSPGEVNEDGTYPLYKVYKRRWFGVVQLTLLNIIVSWDVSVCFPWYAWVSTLLWKRTAWGAERLACDPSHTIYGQSEKIWGPLRGAEDGRR